MPGPIALTGITTITFDADDTLWDFDTGMFAALRRLRAEIGDLVGGAAAVPSVEEMNATRASIEREPAFSDATLDARRREAIRRSACDAGLDDSSLIDGLFDLYVSTRLANTPMFPETEPTLAILGKRFQLGVITNSNTDPAELGLSTRFSFVVRADIEPYQKPDPRIFQHAASLGGYELGSSVHVGDSLETDVNGANRAGAISVWLDRAGDPGDPSISPHHTIRSLSELPRLLGIS